MANMLLTEEGRAKAGQLLGEVDPLYDESNIPKLLLVEEKTEKETEIYKSKPKDEYVTFVNEAAKEWGLSPLLLVAVMTIESNSDPKAKSAANAWGLMQVREIAVSEALRYHGPDRAKKIPGLYVNGKADMTKLAEAQTGMHAGAAVLRMYMDICGGDVEKALQAYNMGIGNFRKAEGDENKIPMETRKYVPRIQKVYDTHKQALSKANLMHYFSGENREKLRKKLNSGQTTWP